MAGARQQAAATLTGKRAGGRSGQLSSQHSAAGSPPHVELVSVVKFWVEASNEGHCAVGPYA